MAASTARACQSRLRFFCRPCTSSIMSFSEIRDQRSGIRDQGSEIRDRFKASVPEIRDQWPEPLSKKKQTAGQLQSVCFPTHRKERDGWGTQFHALWVGKAGGRLTTDH